VLNGPDGPVQREVPLTELRDATAILDELALGCAGCAASGGAGAFACTSFISYPIPEAAEVWLMRRVQTADTIGGQLLLRAIKDLGYTGAKLKAWRARGLLEAQAATSAVVKKRSCRARRCRPISSSRPSSRSASRSSRRTA
jgi:hypothetical protein